MVQLPKLFIIVLLSKSRVSARKDQNLTIIIFFCRRGRGSKSNFQDFLPAGMNSKKSYSNDYPSLQEEYGGQSQSENQQNRPRRGRGQAQRRGQGQRRGNYSNMKDNYVQESKGYYENTRDKEFDRTVSDRNYPSGGDNYGQRNNYRNRDDGYSYERKDDFGNRDNFSRRDNYNNRNTFSGRENYSNQQNYEKRDNFGNRNNFGNKIDNRNNYRSQNKRGNYSDNQRENIDERGDNRRNYGDYTKEDNYRSGNFKGGNNTNPSRYNRDEHGSGRNEVSKESNHEGSNIYDRQSGYSRQKSGEYKRDGPSRYERQNSGGRNQDRSESKDFQKSHSPTREVKRSTLSSYSYHGDADRKSGSTYSKPSPKSYYSLSAMDDEISVTDNLEYDEIEYGQIQKEDMHDFNVTVTEGGSRRSMAKDKGRHVGNRGQVCGFFFFLNKTSPHTYKVDEGILVLNTMPVCLKPFDLGTGNFTQVLPLAHLGGLFCFGVNGQGCMRNLFENCF